MGWAGQQHRQVFRRQVRQPNRPAMCRHIASGRVTPWILHASITVHDSSFRHARRHDAGGWNIAVACIGESQTWTNRNAGEPDAGLVRNFLPGWKRPEVFPDLGEQDLVAPSRCHEHPESSATGCSQFHRRRHAVRANCEQGPNYFRPGHAGPAEFPGADQIDVLALRPPSSRLRGGGLRCSRVPSKS